MNENQVFKLNQHNISVLTRDLYEYLGKVKCCMDGKRIKWNLGITLNATLWVQSDKFEIQKRVDATRVT